MIAMHPALIFKAGVSASSHTAATHIREHDARTHGAHEQGDVVGKVGERGRNRTYTY